MTLYGDDALYIFGAIRNVLLARLFFPGWIVQFYIEKPAADGKTLHPKVPDVVLNKLRDIGAELIEVDSQELKIGIHF